MKSSEPTDQGLGGHSSAPGRDSSHRFFGRPLLASVQRSCCPVLKKAGLRVWAITDPAGRSIRLSGGPSGCVLPEADNYPCQKDKLTSFTDQLVNLSTASLVAETAGSHRRLKVADDEFDRMVEIQLADGAPRRIYLGLSPRPSSVHVRVENRDEVYLSSAISFSDASTRVTDWGGPGLLLCAPQSRWWH